MALSQLVTETIILHLKDGVNLDERNGNPAGEAFVQLTNTLKSQQGFVCQFWGHQVEHPDTFVWSIGKSLLNWESFKHYTAFTESEEYKSFMTGVSQVFDLKVATPLMLYTRWNSDAVAALRAPVTEVSFFTLSTGTSEEAKTAVDDALEPILQNVQTVGKASGSAIGWVFEGMPHAAVGPQPGREWLHGVFGYASIDDHMKWRQQPEHDKAIGIFDGLEKQGLSLQPASVQGVDPSTGYFHVKYRRG